MMKLKPILKLSDGEVQPCAKAFGRRGMIDKLLGLLEVESKKEGFEGVYAVVWSDDQEIKDQLVERMQSALEVKSLVIGRMAPVIGCHLGSGALGVFCY